ncbi:MAG: transposase, partial [Marinomonas sp.]
LRRWLAEVDCRESRRAGRARRPCPTFHVNTATTASVREALVRKVSHDTTLYADESSLCAASGKEYVGHRTVKHTAREYARRAGDVVVHTNTIENVFCIFKRGMTGVYQHCGEAHLHRYLAEFDFRHNRRAVPKNSDVERTNELLAMIDGKRLTYRRIGEAGHAEAEGVSFPPLQRRRKGK